MFEDKSLLAEENYESITTGASNDVAIDMESNVRGSIGRGSIVQPTFDASEIVTLPQPSSSSTDSTLKPIREPILVREAVTSVESRCYGSRPEHFDIGIRVIEAAQLPGLDINPMVRLMVGDRKKTTTIQKSTNSPFWDQYFVISFNQPRLEIFQKVITITVYDSKGLLKSDEVIGLFSCDIGTVFCQPGHSFHRKWALLTDLETNEPRGYLKLDINVLFKGDSSPLSGTMDDEDSKESGEDEDDLESDNVGSDESDIESNLLFPVGVTERQSIKLVIKIYRAYGLTRADSTVKKALNIISSSSSKSPCDAYVSVSFAGSTGRTSVIKKSSSPVWNQQITFVEMFPTFFQNIKFEIKDDELGTDGLLATHYLPLNYISSEGQDGYLPTFGPTFINLYGAARESSNSESKTLSTGLEEGVAYIGRLLVAITTEFVDLVSPDLERMSIQNIGPFDETHLGPKKEFALFGLLNSVSRIEQRYADKPITLELNMGDPDDLDGDGKIDEADKKARAKYRGVTLPIKPAKCFSNNRKENAYHLPLDTVKPIMFHRFHWLDDTWRLFVSNRLTRIAQNLSNGLADVDALTVTREVDAACRLLGVLSQLLENCSSLLQYLQSLSDPPGISRLDKEKMSKQRDQILFILNETMAMRDSVSTSNIVPIVQAVSPWVNEINELASSLHITFPDIFLSMLVEGKRIAQIRLATKDIVYSPELESCGIHAAKFRAILLRQGGRPNGHIRSQVDILCWFGVSDKLTDLVKHFPSGYSPEPSLESLSKSDVDPPTHLKYPERSIFQSRAHLFQARSLIGADTSGLSDPYVKLYYDKCILVSSVKEKTLSPCWDELMIGSQISLIGSREDIRAARLTALAEVYDRDIIGDDELIGRAKVTFDYVRFADEPYILPRLNWFDVWLNSSESGQLLMALELVQISDSDSSEDYPRCLPGAVRHSNGQDIISIPQQIRPTLSKYKLQIIFWGVRDLKRVKLLSVDKPKAEVEVGGYIVSSSVIPNCSKNPNFPSFRKEIELQLPDQEFYCPPLSIRVGDCRAFGRFTLVGTHLVRSLVKYVYSKDKQVDIHHLPKRHIVIDLDHLKPKIGSTGDQLDAVMVSNGGTAARAKRKPDEEIVMMEKKVNKESEEEEIDWWMRYFTSKNGNSSGRRESRKSNMIPYHLTLRVYPEELEKRFDGHSADNKLTAFPLKRGKFDDDTNDTKTMGVFKGAFRLYKSPWKNGIQLLDHLSNNDPVKVLVRVYIVRAYDVIPRDANGKADLYPILKLGSQKFDDSDKFVPNCLDPLFGRVYEFEATFPLESTLTILLKDYDSFSTDELIGKTTIDLEDRYYSDHRFTCGLPRSYQTSGPGKWRDSLKPSQILTKLCRDLKMSHLVITKKYIQIGKLMFTRKQEDASDLTEIPHEDEQLSLGVLNSWKEAFGYSLVPEHVETRSLYRPDKPGVKQGKLEMWIDMFRLSDPRPPPLDIAPRAPRSYELRVVIWNTKDVILDDDSLVSGEKMSDIYIKGWVDDPKAAQQTDTHYRSLTGEGNFNWRFVFRFDFLPAEGVILVRKKDSFFAMNSTDLKIPCKLNLQVWDYDSFSGDDFLGCLPINLIDFPRGARSAKECTLDILSDSPTISSVDMSNNNQIIKSSRINLFKEKRIRGWWPFYANLADGGTELTGKLEADFELLTQDEADANPAGLARDPPQPLDKPQRPDTSFAWFANPWKSFRYIIWTRRKWFFFKLLLFVFLFFFFLIFFYSLPGYTVKKMIGA